MASSASAIDRQRQQGRPENPLEHASVISRLTFRWAYSLLKIGSERPIDESDLPDLANEDTSQFNEERVQSLLSLSSSSPNADHCSNDADNDRNRLGKIILLDYFKSTWLAQLLVSIQMAARIGQVIALGFLVSQFQDRDDNVNNDGLAINNTYDGYKWASVMVICGALSFPAKQLQFFETYRKGMQTRIGLVAAIYDKSLRLSPTSRTSVEPGYITNLASNDVERFINASVSSIYIIWGPLEAIGIVLVGLRTVGVAFVVGLAFLLMMLLPLQLLLSRVFVRLRAQVASRTDARMAWLTQAVSGARVVKFNAWELELERRIMSLRKREVDKIQASSVARAVNEAVYYVSSLSVSVVVFVVDILLGHSLNPQKVYTVLALNNIIQMTLTRLVPSAIMGLSESYIACRRIQSFLELPERRDAKDLECEIAIGGDDSINEDNTVLSLYNVSCYWDGPSVPALQDISLTFQRGKLYLLVGKIGSGKTALLLALAGELPLSSGRIYRRYQLSSFSEQEPWIADGTVRENIIMGLPFRQELYDMILDACALHVDLLTFVSGDSSIVGDRGISLSGGQKARIALARVLYRDEADLILLDDPFAAVDANVAQCIICGIRRLCIERGKTVIISTHQHKYIADCRNIVLMEKGKATETDSCDSSELDDSETTETIIGERSIKRQNESNTDDTKIHLESSKNEQKANAEAKATGIVTFATYNQYSKAIGGGLITALLFLLFTSTQVIFLWTILIIGDWSEKAQADQRSSQWICLVVGMTSTVIFLSFFRAITTFRRLVTASQRLHDGLLHAVLRAKISWYDTQPLGRILNRFSADCGIADDILPLTIFDFLVGSFMAIIGIITAIVVLPFTLIVVPFIVWGFIRLRQTFVRTTREIKRIEGIARSPLFALTAENLIGSTTIHANNLTEYCRQRFRAAHDAHTRAYFAFVSSSRCFAFQIDSLAFILMTTASALAVLFDTQQWLDIHPSTLGLALTLLLQLSQTNLPWIVRQSSEVTNQMVAIERILEYTNSPQEKPFETEYDDDHVNWPNINATSIAFDGYSTRYRGDLPLVLNGVSFTIPHGMRVGVVGRTGSSKSTLAQALFRLLEAEDGLISIGQVDISLLGLHKLRRAMSIVPQSPFLLSGATVRENLDPFSRYNDDDLDRALKVVQLYDLVHTDLPHGKESVISDGTLSVGQRQLFCLCRTILSKTNILVMDEATASCDVHTSDLIYKAIDVEFKSATILNIAHRLEMISGFDLVLVLGEGRVDQFGAPQDLLSDKAGTFFDMVSAQGLLDKFTTIDNKKQQL